ncbi:hypothetical protein L2E82_35932 [Cichorium intybus]|uniref:Uncharacterized protein n=1 Tax=Cichorium intybus TaxID=13427 RepID=A0ACB9BQI7_CICIN|nr:hypothetical protein L2E82_35932 [Cichorium intybus]
MLKASSSAIVDTISLGSSPVNKLLEMLMNLVEVKLEISIGSRPLLVTSPLFVYWSLIRLHNKAIRLDA